MKLDLPKVGGGMMATAPVLMQLSGSKVGWWAGLVMLIIGPLLLGVRHK